MALLAPLGDLVDRRRLIITKSILLVLALLATATASNLCILLTANLAVGLLGSVGQDFIPVSAHLASAENRGRTIGLVTGGLLGGILLSRTVSGAIGELLGWQAIYLIASILVAMLVLAVWRVLPRQPATVSGSYGSLLASLVTLVIRQSVLRKALVTQAVLGSTLGAFWSTLALMLTAPPFSLGASAAGAFGLAGVAGAFGAPLFGGFADRRGPMAAIRLGCLLVAAAFTLMLLEPQSIAALILGAVLFDLGVMAGLVSHQTIVTSIDPAARSRLNGLLMTAAMIGMSLGAVAGGWAWSIAGWTGVCLTGVIAGLLALLRSLLPPSISVPSQGDRPMTASHQPSADAHAGSSPLTVLFSFLSRADSTPLDQRSRADGHIFDVDGKVIADPAAAPSANAFEPDPNLNFEKWGEYWRKVHGVRFLHPDEAADRQTIARLLRYDQIHRLAPGPTSLNPPPYQPPLNAEGRLFDAVIGHIEPYRRPQWDGVAYLSFANLDELGAVLGSERVRRKILPEDRAIFRDLAPVLARQHVIIPNAAGEDSIVLVKTHRRRDGLDRETFQRRWLHEHANLVAEQPEIRRSVKRYVQLHAIGPETAGQPFFHPVTSRIDGVTVLAFASLKGVESFLLSESYAAIEQDERSIAATEAGDYWTGAVFTVVDQLVPERATAK